MSDAVRGPIETDNAEFRERADLVELAKLLPAGSDAYRLAIQCAGMFSLPDRFNQAFIEQGWVFVEFACGVEPAERALTMRKQGASQVEVDDYLAGHLLSIEPIKWQGLKLLGGGMVDPLHPVRASVVERVIQAYENNDYLVVVPLVLMLVDGFGVSVTGTKSMFADLDALDDLFQSSESVAGHSSALKALLAYLKKGQRGYSETELNMPLRNGILHGTRLNYANRVTAAKAINLLAAVVEWGRDIAAPPKDEVAKRERNLRFLNANLPRLKADCPEAALELFQAALTARRANDVVALIDYHPVITLLSEKIREWREVLELQIVIERLGPWAIFGGDHDSEQGARCEARVSVTFDGVTETLERTLYACRSFELAQVGLPSAWRIGLSVLGVIRQMIAARP